ncbi:AAA family ATPase [Alkalibacterium kapii]|uniref:YhaN AAA domain-containing protein n=1 Tax=Alkalibacterium kapii TaxID=426704 RepID=A0A511ATC0_9LACT|nr:AAA family ATPase [Alkalibacterium kapii]GEK91455.1 hypothetical protein AKA01nite_10770 [Alkalibacterium kapii]
MKIKKLIIYGYGKWIDTEFDIDASFHLFFGENEAGKSTLMSFIHSVFFGFPTRHSSLKRYEPKESSRYGGKIIILDERYGEVSIERVSGKVTGDVHVQLEDGTTGSDSLLQMIFHNKSRSFYESIYSFDLKGIEDIQNMGREQLSRFFLSVGALGHEKYLKQADYYNAQADKLFKPMGRNPKINQLQLELKNRQIEVEKAKERNEAYINLIKNHLEKKDQREKIEQKLTGIEKDLNYLIELSTHKETLEEAESIEQYLKGKSDLKLPKDGLYQWKQLNNDIVEYQMKIDERQLKQKSLQDQFKPSKELILYQENEDSLKQFENKLDFWEDKVHLLQLKKKDLSNVEQTITELKIRENIPFSDSIPDELEPSDIDYLNASHERLQKLDKSLTELQENKKSLQYKITINNEMIDKIEPKLLPLSDFAALDEMNSEQGSLQEKRRLTFFSVIPLLILFISSVYLVTVDLLYAAVTFVLFLMIAYVRLRKYMNSKQNEQKDQQLFYEQRNLRHQWKELLAMNDVYQSDLRSSVDQISEIEAAKQQIQQAFSQWKKDHSFAESISLLNISEKRAIYKNLRGLIKKASTLRQEVEAIETHLNKQLNEFENTLHRTFLAENVIEKFKEMRNIYREIKKEQQAMQDYIKQTEAVQHDINYFVEKINDLKKAKQQFLESLNIEREEDIYDLYSEQETIQEKKNKLEILKAKLPVKEGQDDIRIELTNLNANRDRLNKDREMLVKQQKDIEKKIMSDEMKIKQLEDGGLYTDLLQKFENEKSYYQETVEQWTALKTAAGIIEKTLHYAKKDSLPQALSVAESYFKFLTDNKYQKLFFEGEDLFAVDKLGKKWGSKDLSRGTVEPLYISLRLAFIKTAKDKLTFPILIDDPFVNLDNQRVQNMYQLLSEFDETIQVIFFSFDPRVKSFTKESKCVYLN